MDNEWLKVSRDCKKLNLESRVRLINLFNKKVMCENSLDWLGQMSSIQIPDCNVSDLYDYLKSNNIEVPIMEWNSMKILRISIQAYNSRADIDLLIKHLKRYFN